MKNKIALILFSCVLVATPLVSSAYFLDANTLAQLQAQITSLLKQVLALQAKVVQMQTSQNTQTQSAPVTPNLASSPDKTLISSDAFVNFNVIWAGPNPPVYNLHLTNSSQTSINYTLSMPDKPNWLNCGYAVGALTLGPGQVAEVCVAVDTSKVNSPGKYTTNLVVSGNFSNSPITIPITLTVSS